MGVRTVAKIQVQTRLYPNDRARLAELAFKLQRKDSEIVRKIFHWAMNTLTDTQIERLCKKPEPMAKSIKKALDGQREAAG